MRNFLKRMAKSRRTALAALMLTGLAAAPQLCWADDDSSGQSLSRSEAVETAREKAAESRKRAAEIRARARKARENASNGSQADEDRARLQGRSSITRRSQPKRGGGKKSGSKQTALPEFKINAETRYNAVYFDPSTRYVDTGREFPSTVYFYNGTKSVANRFEIWVQYNPEMIEPVWVDLAPIEDRTTAPVEPIVLGEEGYVGVSAELSPALSNPVNPMFTIHWKTLDAAGGTQLNFTDPPGGTSGVWDLRSNLIETTELGNKARVSAQIRITDPAVDPHEVQPLSKFIANSVYEAYEPIPDDPLERCRLVIVPDREMVATGEVSVADVVLLNPLQLDFDRIRFRIRYNPEDMRILDADELNYITEGVNLWDGGFHDRYPFDRHVADNVDPARGVIEYEMASNMGPKVYESGIVARIVFRMLREAGSGIVWFEPVDPVNGSLTCDVTNEGRSLMGGTPEQTAEALHGERIVVKPRVP